MQSEKSHIGAADHVEPAHETVHLSVVLGLLYESPLSDNLLKPVLQKLCELTQSRNGFFVTGDNHTGMDIRVQAKDQAGVARLAAQCGEGSADKDPFRLPILQTGRTGVVDDESLLPHGGLLRTELYRDQLQPMGLRYAMFVITAASADRIEALCLWRTMSQGPFPAESRNFLERLYPHIERSLQLRHALRTTEQRLAGVEAMLDLTPAAAFLVTRRGHLLRRNAAAEAILEAGDALTLENGTLVGASHQSREALRALLQKTGESPDKTIPVSGAQTTIAIQPKWDRHPLYLLAMPLPPAERTSSGADIMLLVSDPDSPITVPHDVLQSLFGLTPALADVANRLLNGYSLDEIARLRQVSIGTVRQQLKSILGNTGTARQTDLVRLLLSLPRQVFKKITE